MLELFRAEWQKIFGHRWLTGFLVWIFPVGVGTFMGLAILYALLSPDAAEGPIGLGRGRWDADMVAVWALLVHFPGNVFGRLLLLTFTGVLFAGEYEWGTWKNIVPHNRRVTLILMKFLVLGVFILVVFNLTSVIGTVGHGIAVSIAGGDFGPKLDGKVLSDFTGDYALEVTLASASTIIVTGYAALAAMFTRSIISGLLVGLLLSVLESTSLVVLLIIGQLSNKLEIVKLYLLTPSYNLENVALWVKHHRGFDLNSILNDASASPEPAGLAFSVVILAVWVFGLIALTAFLFRRQDITT